MALGALALAMIRPTLAAGTQIARHDETKLHEVLITAYRRATNLQLTPVSATVLTAKDLDRQNIQSVDDLEFATPSITVQSSGQNALINIRGIGRDDGGQQMSSGVVIYRDGVETAPHGLISDEPYYDIGSIEVLRGPQGTFGGQSAIGGAIFVTEADPQLNRSSAYVQAQYGNYDDERLRGMINVPLSDDLAIRFATDDEHRHTFFHMSGPWTGNPGNLHSANARLSTLWQPSEAFRAVLKLDYNYIDHGGSPAAPFTGSTADVFDVASDSYLSGFEHQFRGVLHLNYRFADGTAVKSITGYQDGRLAYSLDADGTATPPPLGLSPEIFVARAKDRTVSQEIDVISPTTGRFTWVAGTVYQDDRFDNPQFILSLAPGGTITSGLAISAAKYQDTRRTWALFAQGSYAIIPALKLQIGARYTHTTFTLDELANVLLFGIPIGQQLVNGQQLPDSHVTGKVSLNWTLNRSNYLYAFVATGHKGGGINSDGAVFQPENVTDYEIGWKATALRGHVRTQLDGFYDNYRDFQLPIFVPTIGAGIDANATGTTVVNGVEAQLQAAVGGLALDLGASYVHSSLGHFSAIDSRYVAKGAQELTGRSLPNAPHWTAQAGAQYTFSLGGDRTLTPRVDYSYLDSRWATVFQVAPYDHLYAQNIVNTDLTLTGWHGWRLTAYATNVFDLHYVTLQLLGNLAQPGPPRQYGIRISKRF